MTARPRSAREERGATVVAVHRPRGGDDAALALAFRSPRTVILLPETSFEPKPVALAVAGLSSPAPTVLLEGGGPLEAHRDALLRVLPRAEVLSFEPAPILGFLRAFRDREDPLLLGHAGELAGTDATLATRGPPGVAEGGLEAFEEIREMLLTMGFALGVRPPLPRPLPAPGGWSLTRLAGLCDAVAGLYAGLLHRWGSPLGGRLVSAPP